MVRSRLLVSAALLAALPLGLAAQDAGSAPPVADPPAAQEGSQVVTPGGALTSPDVRQSQMPAPTPQGTRPPGVLEGTDGELQGEEIATPEVRESQPEAPSDQGGLDPEIMEGAESEPVLYQLLAQVRRAPPGLDGQPNPRPNALASEPAKEMPPAQPEELYLFPDGYIE